MTGKLFIITGPSGVGKTTVAKALVEVKKDIEKLITYTTRPIRDHEADGVDYNFVDNSTFEKMIENNELFEWAKVYDHYYGNKLDDLQKLLDSGKNVLLVIDVQGASTVKRKRDDAIIFFITAESKEILLERLMKRDHGKTTNLKEREEALRAELEFGSKCNYQIVNRQNNIDETIGEILDIMNRK